MDRGPRCSLNVICSTSLIYSKDIMASQKDIITLPHPSLRTSSKRVGYITDDIRKLLTSMTEALLDWEDHRQHEVGVALAAVQINQLFRVIVIRNDFDNRKDRTFLALINPEITKYEGVIEEDFEGCLSVKNIYGRIPRHSKIRVKGLDLSGKEVRLKAEGFLARTLQHEIDHTNGKMIVDHIKNRKDAFYRLTDKGELKALDYNVEIKGNKDLWDGK